MPDTDLLQQGSNEIETYLQSGSQTQITPEIDRLVSTIEGSVLEKTQKILEIVDSF
ncbi:MAG: hypothetical protein WCR68_00675 [Candidatus Dojkabacteria bacterium]